MLCSFGIRRDRPFVQRGGMNAALRMLRIYTFRLSIEQKHDGLPRKQEQAVVYQEPLFSCEVMAQRAGGFMDQKQDTRRR